MRRYALAFAMCLAAPVASAQTTWGNLDALMFPYLTQSGAAEASFWLPDAADAAAATRALGIVYEYIPGSAGNTSIATGLFVKQPAGWVFAGPVEGVFGHAPQDARFTASFVDVTTLTLGPNDARCCPTQLTRWRIDFASLQAVAFE